MKRQSTILLGGLLLSLIGCGKAEDTESHVSSLSSSHQPQENRVEEQPFELEACSWQRPGDCVRNPIDEAGESLKRAQEALSKAFERAEFGLDVRNIFEDEALAIAKAQGNPDRKLCQAAVAAGIAAFAAEKGLAAGPWGAVVSAFLGAGGGLLLGDSACSKAYP